MVAYWSARTKACNSRSLGERGVSSTRTPMKDPKAIHRNAHLHVPPAPITEGTETVCVRTHSWLIAIASSFATMSQSSSTSVSLLTLNDSTNGLEVMQCSPKFVRSSTNGVGNHPSGSGV